jgi:digeranylgeranylglycerophospholipid reductase
MPRLAQESDLYDVIVVGASFAGLSFASVAAALGLRVLVVERDTEIGRVVRTTGVLFNDVLDIIDVPARYLINAVRRIQLLPPDHSPIEINVRTYRFYMADVPGLLRWMAEQAEAHGATIRSGTTFLDMIREQNGLMRVTLGVSHDPSKSNTVCTDFLIGADGARSKVAQCLGLDQNTRYLAGAEWLIEGITVDQETFFLVMSHQLAPGYCLWLAPHGNIAALGVAGHPRAFNPTESLRAAQALFKDVADFSHMHIVQRKAGLIPTGGRLQRVYRDDKRGRGLLLGDAAGLCGAATGGGIYPALLSGRLSAHAVASEVLNGERNAVKAYLRNLPHAGRLGHYLRIEDWIRWVLDSMKSDADVKMLYSLFGSPGGRKVLQRVLLETPIIGMDSNFFALIRNLLSQHPSLYGSVLQTTWHRITARGHSKESERATWR